MKKGFTLIELVVVLIIVAVLGTLGLTQYTQLIEKARGAEAKEILGSIRKLAAAYYMEWNNATGLTASMVGIGAPGGVPGPAAANCAPSHYFSYGLTSSPTAITTTATRCMATGKIPQGSTAGTLILTSTLSTGVDGWSGNGGYN